ncbi:MAG: DUF2726 domain-containing protein [Chthoniobacteraceae bacterium]
MKIAKRSASSGETSTPPPLHFSDTPAPLPYKSRGCALSRAERSFYEVLKRAIGDDWVVFVKMRLSDIVTVPRTTPSWQSHFNRVQSKHVDFVVCDRQQVRLALIVELDDSSHHEKSRVERDKFVDEVLGAAGLPIVHVTARAAYSLGEVRSAVEPHLAFVPDSEAALASP